MEEKQERLREIGIDHLVLIPFTTEFAKTTSKEFISKILVQAIGTRKLIIGYNHRFGKNREGRFESLIEDGNKYGFEIEEIPKHEIDNIGISSTKIRKALADGDVAIADHYLGHPFLLNGLVIHGDKLGRKIGFPTANLEIEEAYKLIPADGVYAVKIGVEGNTYSGMLNIGYQPTVMGKNRKIEVHIIDFDENIYNKKLTISFVKRIRDVQKFQSIDHLKLQLNNDKQEVTKILQ
jgi:riboflavin kinase/FMN adenylyltransferase